MQGLAVVPLFAGYDLDRDAGRIFSYDVTGGPDLARRIFPVVQVITAEGGHRLADSEVAVIADAVIAGRMNRPDGPASELTS
jgi:hypothetical protein